MKNRVNGIFRKVCNILEWIISADIMTLAVGVELIKMLSQHTPATVVEVLMFAIAREMVTHHDSAINTAIGVMSICALFATRKFFFCKNDYDEKDEH